MQEVYVVVHFIEMPVMVGQQHLRQLLYTAIPCMSQDTVLHICMYRPLFVSPHLQVACIASTEWLVQSQGITRETYSGQMHQDSTVIPQLTSDPANEFFG